MFFASPSIQAEEPVKDTSLKILEALKIALPHVPEGKSVHSIYLVKNEEEGDYYLALYGEEIVEYAAQEMGPDGKFKKTKKYKKARVGIKVKMSREVEVGVSDNSRGFSYSKRVIRRKPIIRTIE